MAVPQEPYINIQDSEQFGTITANGSFYWYNSGLSGSCTVTIIGGWCNASSYGPISAGNSVQATVKSGTSEGEYDWSSGCCQDAMPVHVSGGHPHPPGKNK